MGEQLAGAPTQLSVVAPARDRIPRPGEKPPATTTDTGQSANGNLESIDTRIPPSDMHDANFADGEPLRRLNLRTEPCCSSSIAAAA